MKTTSLALGTTVLALLVAGCGGSDNKSTTTASSGTATTPARGYTETGQALDAICAKADAEAKPLSAQANGNAKHDAALLVKLVAINDKYIPQIKAITPDPKLQSTYDAFVASLDTINAQDKNV